MSNEHYVGVSFVGRRGRVRFCRRAECCGPVPMRKHGVGPGEPKLVRRDSMEALAESCANCGRRLQIIATPGKVATRIVER